MATQHDRDVMSELPRQVNQSFDLNLLDYAKIIRLLQDTDVTKKSNVSYKDGIYQKVTMNVSPSQTQDLIQLLIGELKKYNNSYSQKLIQYLNDLRFPEGFTYEAYYTEETVKYREVEGYYNYKGQQTDFNLDFETRIKGDEFQVEMDLEVDHEENPLNVHYQAIGQPKSENYKVSRMFVIDGQKNVDAQWETRYSDQEKRSILI
ncbi:hypothetical protein [Piscibacillus salipiscarius]|uniref:hypothetical protein n=1 Tax=Piscibacillus salipiscarius TaxID=299480 RepID=UPI0006CF7158|nr:hypothetical protein [Piscibacillus salipiscarius]